MTSDYHFRLRRTQLAVPTYLSIILAIYRSSLSASMGTFSRLSEPCVLPALSAPKGYGVASLYTIIPFLKFQVSHNELFFFYPHDALLSQPNPSATD